MSAERPPYRPGDWPDRDVDGPGRWFDDTADVSWYEDDAWYDDGGDLDEEVVDDLLRQHFATTYPVGDTSLATLTELRPRVAKARRRHQVTQVVSYGAAACVLALAGFLATTFLQFGVPGSVTTSPAGQGVPLAGPDPDPTPSHAPLPTPVDPRGRADDESGTGADQGDHEEEAGSQDAEAGSEAGDASEADAEVTTPSTTPEAGASSVGSTGTTSSTTASSSTTTTTRTASTAPPPTTLESECGFLYYRFDGARLELVSVDPRPRHADVDVRSSGPTVISVSIEGGDEHCDLELTIVDGRVRAADHED